MATFGIEMLARKLEAVDTLVQCDTTFAIVSDTLLNDDCSSTANWNVYGASTTLSIVGGQLNVNSSTSGFGWGTSQYFTTQAGVTYTVSFYLDMGSCTGSSIRSEIIDNTFSASTYGSYTTSGPKTYTFTATGSGFGGITFVMNFPGAACDFSIDSVLITFDTTVVNTVSCDTSVSNRNYRYGFNRMEKDDDIKGDRNSYDYGARMYDSRLGRWLSIDPYFRKYVPIGPYTFTLNNPIYFVDGDGKIVLGTDGKPVTIEKGPDGAYVIKGSPDESTTKLFSAMLKTTKGAEAVLDYTTSRYEFKFKEVSSVTEGQDHAETYEVDEKGKRLSEEGSGEFHHFQVDYTVSNTQEGDRMATWSNEEKLNVIGTHEKAHERGGLLVDADHKKGGRTLTAELVTRFQYSILYPDNSSDEKNWVGNYKEKMGDANVLNAYKDAVNGLVNDGKITREKGDQLIEQRTKENEQPKKQD